MTHSDAKNVIIIGAGPAGYTAAIYAARAGHRPLLFTGESDGGQLTLTLDVENYPGFKDPVSSMFLMVQMKEQAILYGTEVLSKKVESVQSVGRDFCVRTTEGQEFFSRSVIVATGAKARWLGCEGEQEYMSRGVSGCAKCDGLLFRGKDVAIVGGGSHALEDALFLANCCNKVYLIHRSASFKAEGVLQERVRARENIEMILHSNVRKVLGDGKRVVSIDVHHQEDDSVRNIAVSALFVAIGRTPDVEIVRDLVDIDANGYIWTDGKSTRTSYPGVFAAGDVQDSVYKQAVTAAGTGCMAAIDVDTYLMQNNVGVIKNAE